MDTATRARFLAYFRFFRVGCCVDDPVESCGRDVDATGCLGMVGMGSLDQFICADRSSLGVQLPTFRYSWSSPKYSHLAIVGQRSVAEDVGHSETVTGFHDCGGSSLQLLELSVELSEYSPSTTYPTGHDYSWSILIPRRGRVVTECACTSATIVAESTLTLSDNCLLPISNLI